MFLGCQVNMYFYLTYTSWESKGQASDCHAFHGKQINSPLNELYLTIFSGQLLTQAVEKVASYLLSVLTPGSAFHTAF